MSALIEVKGLKKHFHVKNFLLRALDGISFSIFKGETLAIVGESGSGKSTLGKTMLRLYEPTEGEVYFEGQNLFSLSPKGLRDLRQKMQIIFQDPFSTLNPRMTLRAILQEALSQNTSLEDKKDPLFLLHMVGLSFSYLDKYPHELSGGQRQRIGIARAIAVEPQFIVCDEPISSLDVSIQAQIINLLLVLQEKLNLTYLFISHDLAIVEYMANRIAVMYFGRIVELAEKKEFFQNPLHPYTQALIASSQGQIPSTSHSGENPSPFSPPKGCAFCTRCPKAHKICFNEKPAFKEIEKGHFAACHLY